VQEHPLSIAAHEHSGPHSGSIAAHQCQRWERRRLEPGASSRDGLRLELQVLRGAQQMHGFDVLARAQTEFMCESRRIRSDLVEPCDRAECSKRIAHLS
jgi:hypothetical protein